MTRNRNRNIGLLLIVALLTTGMSGIVGATYDEDGVYVGDVSVYTSEEFVYVVYPFDMTAVTVDSVVVEPFDMAVATATSYADGSTMTSAYVDMTVPGVQGLVGEEE